MLENNGHQEKHKVSAKRSWRKLHITVDQNHYIHKTVLLDFLSSNEKTLEELMIQRDKNTYYVFLDGSYDSHDIYQHFLR